ncbi:MAG: HAD-IA family hydrolase [Lachnospiraceae bacterium]|nr:HAD-IA family hydrolase [Lachnospiraceae bacterium]
MMNTLEGIKAYIFDLDDTLYDEEQYVSSAISDVCRYISNKHNIEYDALFDYCMHSIQVDGRGNTFNKLCDEFSITEDIKQLVDIYKSCNPILNLYDDADEVIKYLKENNKKIGIITDGNAKVQNSKVRALGLYELADSVILTGNLRDGDKAITKPDERVYKACLDELNVPTVEAVYVGDNPLKDFVGAKKIGMKTVRIIRNKGMFMNEIAPSNGYEADITIRSLRELI